MNQAILKYLEKYAEPESEASARIDGDWSKALVVPICDEEVAFTDFFQAATVAAQKEFEKQNKKVLFIFVLNAREDADPKVHQANQILFERILKMGDERFHKSKNLFLKEMGEVDVLLVDRTTQGNRFPSKQGVGLARKIGAGVALSLFANKKLLSPWVFSTDADVLLPRDYFDLPEAPNETSTLLFPFKHIFEKEDALSRATLLYEQYLHYYVDGLKFAGSPYGFHTVGSTLVFHAEKYAEVRGFPKLQAGEDFHFLRKISKVGEVVSMQSISLHCDPILIRSRFSNRIPFGTGPSVQKMLEEGLGHFKVHDPKVFVVLKEWLVAIDLLAQGKSVAFKSQYKRFLEKQWAHFQPQFQKAFSNCKTVDQKRKQVHVLFDSLRTLQFIHQLEETLLPQVLFNSLANDPFRRMNGFANDKNQS